MTNENMIKQLKRLIPSLQYADDVNAVKGAIKALSQEPTDENLHREREQAYMQGYEDASKRFRQEPCDTYTEGYFKGYDDGLEQKLEEPCEDIAQGRYKDLCEYFGDAKDILKSREDFKAWLERVKWHIRKAEELYEKYEYKKEPCDDAISREVAIRAIKNLYPDIPRVAIVDKAESEDTK